LFTRAEGVELPEAPVLVVVLEGWIDAGFAASAAIGAVLSALETKPYARFAGDELIDHRARRPRLRITDGRHDGLTWAEPELRVGTDRLGAAVAVLNGPEPDLRWHSFTGAVTELASELGVRLMVGLGGYPAPVPHTRPVRLTATASSQELADKVGYLSGTIEVPSGIQSVIETACAAAGIPALGLWARVPHYVAAMPYPEASVALVDGLATTAGLALDTSALQNAAATTRRRIEELIAESDEHMSMVRELESRVDELEPMGPLPSGDEIAAELERYLRGEGRN
jgi:hypothetical protein